MEKNRRKTGFVILCLAPAVILFVLFMIVPTVDVFRISLYKWGGYTPNKTFVGLENFAKLFQNDKFFRAFQNNVYLIVVVSLITFSFAIVFAAILSREKIKGQNFFRIIFYIPNILSIVIIGAIFSAVFDPNQGLLNSLIALFHGGTLEKPILWLGGKKLVIHSVAIAMVWQAIGYYMVMYMASMANIPESLYESASLDGAGRLKQFFSITLPLIWTNIRTTLTFFIISTINMSFLIVKAMTNGGPNGASDVFLSYMYQEAYTNSSYGYGMSIGVMVFLFSFTLAAVVNAVTKRDEIEF